MHMPRRIFSGLLTLLFGALLCGPVFAQAPNATVNAQGLKPGDYVQLIVWRNPEMSGEFEVAPDSTLGHPILREVKVAGVPLAVAEERLRVFLGRFDTNPSLVLLPRYRVFVLGEVGSPGLQVFSPNTSIAEAILLSGGETDRSRMDRVRLIRGGQERVLDLEDFDSSHGRELVQSGDRILVERRRSIFRDFIVPVATFTGSIAAIFNFLDRL